MQVLDINTIILFIWKKVISGLELACRITSLSLLQSSCFMQCTDRCLHSHGMPHSHLSEERSSCCHIVFSCCTVVFWVLRLSSVAWLRELRFRKSDSWNMVGRWSILAHSSLRKHRWAADLIYFSKFLTRQHLPPQQGWSLALSKFSLCPSSVLKSW